MIHPCVIIALSNGFLHLGRQGIDWTYTDMTYIMALGNNFMLFWFHGVKSVIEENINVCSMPSG